MSQQPILKLHDAVTGRHYELRVEQVGTGFEARWVVKDGGGLVVVDAFHGVAVADDPGGAFRKAKRAIEDRDATVMGNDWDFGQPPPAWLDD